MQHRTNVRKGLVKNRMQTCFRRRSGIALDGVTRKVHHHDITRHQLAFVSAGHRDGDMLIIDPRRIVAAGSRRPALAVEKPAGINDGLRGNGVAGYVKQESPRNRHAGSALDDYHYKDERAARIGRRTLTGRLGKPWIIPWLSAEGCAGASRSGQTTRYPKRVSPEVHRAPPHRWAIHRYR